MTYYIVLLLLFAYIWGSGIYRQTWAGMSACFSGLHRVVLSLYVSGSLENAPPMNMNSNNSMISYEEDAFFVINQCFKKLSTVKNGVRSQIAHLMNTPGAALYFGM